MGILRGSVLGITLATLVSQGCGSAAVAFPPVAPDDGADSGSAGLLTCTEAQITYKTTTFTVCKEAVDEIFTRMLHRIADTKEYEQRILGMEKTSNYTLFQDGKMKKTNPVYEMFVLPKQTAPTQNWRFVFVAEAKDNYTPLTEPIQFQSYADTLTDERDTYKSKGYDVQWRIIYDYGTNAQITPSFMESEGLRQIELILHEDFHQTLDKREKEGIDARLEESIATFVGLAGFADYAKHLGDSEQIADGKKALEDRLAYSLRVNNAATELAELSKKGLSDSAYAQQRKQILTKYQLALNEAQIMAEYRYTRNFPIMMDIYHASGDDVRYVVKISYSVPEKLEDGERYLAQIRDRLRSENEKK